MKFIRENLNWQLIHNDESILSCLENSPLIFVGYGSENVKMHRGNFSIEDYIVERVPLTVSGIRENNSGEIEIDFEGRLKLSLSIKDDCAELKFHSNEKNINRFWLRVNADKEEYCWGCGEQMSYFNLRGRHFPLWTSEPGVGRDKKTYVTWKSDVDNMAGGDYYNTNYPQPTFVSSRKYYLHVDTTAYADFDFRHENFHELQIWEVPALIRIEGAKSFVELLEKETALFGRQPILPEWIYDGLIAGLQGGSERSLELLDKTLQNGIKVCGIWCQDWSGKRVTSFGKRVQWDWHYNNEMYPDLPELIKNFTTEA